MNTFPDPRSLARAELTSLIEELIGKEQVVSEERQALHAQIDALRAELVVRLRDEGHHGDLWRGRTRPRGTGRRA
ncbi:MAG: hypothetical protein WBP81_33360 [Solirubrobacteraceae bacterium]